MMDERGQSDRSVVPGKPPNKAEEPAAEAAEGRERAKGNSPERNALRTPSRVGAPSELERVRQAAERDRKEKFTALLHHVYDIERLLTAYHALKRGAYRAKTVRRAFITKANRRLRPLGVPALEDKHVQRAVVAVLNAIYE